MATGILNEEMQEKARPDPESSAGKKQRAAAGLTVQAIRDKIDVPPELKEALDRIVAAGMKVMYSEETHQNVMEMMPKDGSPAQNLGVGISRLISLLYEQSNKTLPPQLMIPAGLVLLIDAADYLKQSGEMDIEDRDIGEATIVMITEIFKLAGGNADMAMQLVDQMGLSQGANPERPEGAGETADNDAPADEEYGPAEEPDETEDEEA